MKLYLSSFKIGDHPKKMLFSTANDKVAVVQNALDCFSNASKRASHLEREFAELRAIGLVPTELDLREYFSNESALHRVLEGFSYLWVVGGNTFVLRRAFRQSGLDKIILERAKDDSFVYGGYSAGACVISPSLKGIHLIDEPEIIPEGYANETLWVGLNLYPFCIAPHYNSDHPESAGIEKTVRYYIENKVPFVAIRDGEAITYNTLE